MCASEMLAVCTQGRQGAGSGGASLGAGVCRVREAVHLPASAPLAAKPMREVEKT